MTDPRTSDALHGFTSEELNKYFSSIVISSSEELSPCTAKQLRHLKAYASLRYRSTTSFWQFCTSNYRQGGKMEYLRMQLLSSASNHPHLQGYLMRRLSKGSFLRVGNRPVSYIALKKSSASSWPSDFSLITLLCFLSKVIQMLSHDQMNYLNSSNILDQDRLQKVSQHIVSSPQTNG